MRPSKIIIIPFLLLAVCCLGQTTEKKELYKLFSGFSIDSSRSFISEFCNQNNCSTQANIYDATKTDYKLNEIEYSAIVHQPTTAYFNNYYSFKHALGDTIPEEALISSLTLSYQDTSTNFAKKEYESLIRKFKKLYRHSAKAYIVSEHGREGEWVKFYVSRISKLPMLTIELSYPKEGTIRKASSVIINYIRPYREATNAQQQLSKIRAEEYVLNQLTLLNSRK